MAVLFVSNGMQCLPLLLHHLGLSPSHYHSLDGCHCFARNRYGLEVHHLLLQPENLAVDSQLLLHFDVNGRLPRLQQVKHRKISGWKTSEGEQLEEHHADSLLACRPLLFGRTARMNLKGVMILGQMSAR